MSIVNLTRSATMADHVAIAASFQSRARGLIGRTALPEGHALVLHPCRGVHAIFLAFALDVIYLDRDDRAIHILCLTPWHVGPIVRQSGTVIELPAGTTARTGTVVGDLIAWRELDDDSALEGSLQQRS